MVRITRPGGRIVAQENDLVYVVYYPSDHAGSHRAAGRVALFHWDRVTAWKAQPKSQL